MDADAHHLGPEILPAEASAARGDETAADGEEGLGEEQAEPADELDEADSLRPQGADGIKPKGSGFSW